MPCFVEVSRSRCCFSSTGQWAVHNESWKLLKVVSSEHWEVTQSSRFLYETLGVITTGELFWGTPVLFTFLGLSAFGVVLLSLDRSVRRWSEPVWQSCPLLFLNFYLWPSFATLLCATLPFRYWRDAACCISVVVSQFVLYRTLHSTSCRGTLARLDSERFMRCSTAYQHLRNECFTWWGAEKPPFQWPFPGGFGTATFEDTWNFKWFMTSSDCQWVFFVLVKYNGDLFVFLNQLPQALPYEKFFLPCQSRESCAQLNLVLWQKIIFAYYAQLLDEWHLPENEWTSKRNLCREPWCSFAVFSRAFVAGFDLRSFSRGFHMNLQENQE